MRSLIQVLISFFPLTDDDTVVFHLMFFYIYDAWKEQMNQHYIPSLSKIVLVFCFRCFLLLLL